VAEEDRGNGQESPQSAGKRKSPGVWPAPEVMRDIIFKKAGIVSQVAEAVGMTPRSVQRRIAEDQEFRTWFEESREARLDMSESMLFRKILSGNIAATIFHLKCQGKARGWVERSEVSGPDGRPLVDVAGEARKVTDVLRAAMSDPEVRRRAVELQELIDERAADLEDAVRRH
jgi:hypothetical protein